MPTHDPKTDALHGKAVLKISKKTRKRADALVRMRGSRAAVVRGDIFEAAPVEPARYVDEGGPAVDHEVVAFVAIVVHRIGDGGKLLALADILGRAVFTDQVPADVEADNPQEGVIHDVGSGQDRRGRYPADRLGESRHHLGVLLHQRFQLGGLSAGNRS